MANRLTRYGWTTQQALLALLMVGLGVVATFGAWADIFHIAWVDQEASHVMLVLPVSAWLVWVRRARFRQCRVRPTYIGPVLVLVGWVASSWGYRNSTQFLWHMGAVVVVVGCLLSVLGRELLFRFLPAFVVLGFLVPVPGMVRQRISVPLMTATAKVTAGVSEILGVPVERSGNQLSINGQKVGIAEACNGLRMVFALVLVSYAFAFGEPLRHYVRLIILAASPLSAIVCNVIRLVPTLWLYGYGEELVTNLNVVDWLAKMFEVVPKADEELAKAVGQYLAHGFHNAAGWVMLVVAFLLLMSIIRVLRWALIPVTHYTLASEH